MIYLDFETRSRCDLTKRGAYNYALDASTDVLCMAYAIDDGDVQVWRPGEPFPNLDGHQIVAHNAAFERLIFWYVLDKRIPLERFYCTASQARANCLPGSLEDVGRAVSSRMRKDHRGSQLIRLLSIPREDGTFNNDPTLMQEMVDYCVQDVRVMREVSKAMRPLSADELSDYHCNERINDRGILIDVELCRAAVKYSGDELAEVQQLFREITGLTSVRSPKMRQWVQERVGPEALKLMTVHKDGVAKMSVDKSVRASLLILHEENKDEVPNDVADVLQCADDVWSSSVAKFSRMAEISDEEDGRARGAFVFAGGSATGRYSSYGIQLHNLPRKCAKDADDLRRLMVRGHALAGLGSTSAVLKSMLRPALIPAKGNVFVVLDWAGIEARVNPWLSKSDAGETKLDLFRNGGDVYKTNAAATFNCRIDDVTKDQRQIGKVQELALGFGGSVGAFASMGRAYGVVVTEAEAKKMVMGWRKANPWMLPYGQSVERAYMSAMRNKGREVAIARTAYLYDGSNLWYALPSGRVLCYPQARFDEDGSISYLKAAFKPAANAKEWPRSRLWYGLAMENLTQATANDLLRHTLRQLDSDGVRVIAHVHDEIVIECAEADAGATLSHAEKVMTTPPAWAVGLPLAVEGKAMTRYGKG